MARVNSRGPVYWLGAFVAAAGLVLLLLGIGERVFGVPAFGTSPLWYGAVAILLGWAAMAGGRKRVDDDRAEAESKSPPVA